MNKCNRQVKNFWPLTGIRIDLSNIYLFQIYFVCPIYFICFKDPAHPAMKSSKPQSGTASTVDKPKLPTKIPDILPPIVVRLDDDEMTYGK